MSKRQRDHEDISKPPKRPKPELSNYVHALEDIQFARQLQQLLTFRQDSIQQLRNGIASFKAFLESILYHRDEDSRPRQLSILREYLDTQKPSDSQDTEKPFLGQLWQAWSFSSQNNNDYLSSQVSAIFALVLRTLSSLLDFREYGILLGRTVLQHQHMRLVRRGLDAPRHKDFVISPCLRLLTEVTSFDGGALAREVYKRREQTFDVSSLRRNLGLLRTEVSEEEAKRKPSVRTLTVRYVLAHLKCLHEGGKVDLLKSRPLCIALLQHLADDPPDVVNEILSVTEQNVLKDSELPRSAKAVLLTQHNLERVTEVATRSGDDYASSDRAFAWLKAVCTTSSYGILRASGWYPPGTTNTQTHIGDMDSAIDLGLDSLEFYDRSERPDVRNTTLLGWLQTLRPHSDPKERELVITCFESAPELVAPYFAKKHMQLEPKLSNTWIGYASFLFEVIRSPVPAFSGNAESAAYTELPPQTAIVLESVLPRPLTQRVLTRCLNQSSELINLFAVRILVLAFQKLSEVLAEMRKAADLTADDGRPLWQEAADRLLARFTQRAPVIKDVVAAFRKVPDDDEHAMQREAVSRLLRLYYEVTPVHALEEQFDVSTALTAALTRSERDTDAGEAAALRALELEHLLVVAQHSMGMRWFSKSGGLEHSPIVSLLRLHVSNVQDRQIRALIGNVLQQHDLVVDASACTISSEHPSNELDALMASILNAGQEDTEMWSFVDDCMLRATRQPVKYVDRIDAALATNLGGEKYSGSRPGLLAAAVVEQAPFVVKKPTVIQWVDCYLHLLCRIRTRSRASLQLHTDVLKIPGWEDDDIEYDAPTLLAKAHIKDPQVIDVANVRPSQQERLPFAPPPCESDNHPELLRWAQKDLDVTIEDCDVDGLMLCLCSQYADVRRQALAQLRKLFIRLQDSTLENKGHLAVLIGELSETFEQQCLPDDKPLPYLAGTFAARALHVIGEPTHFLYPKLNRFIMKSPDWRISHLPSYWLSSTILSQPTEDDAYWKEVHWVVEWLVDGFRTAADLDTLRRGDVFEKAMALYSSPGAERMKGLRGKVIELLYRATCVEGGSDVLVTRTGVLSWLGMVRAGEDNVVALMKRRVLETCNRERMGRWSGVPVEQL